MNINVYCRNSSPTDINLQKFTKSCRFKEVFTCETSNRAIFQCLFFKDLQLFSNGYNISVILLGDFGTAKTSTLFGKVEQSLDSILFHFLNAYFTLNGGKGDECGTLGLNVFQVDDHHITDLLCSQSPHSSPTSVHPNPPSSYPNSPSSYPNPQSLHHNPPSLYPNPPSSHSNSPSSYPNPSCHPNNLGYSKAPSHPTTACYPKSASHSIPPSNPRHFDPSNNIHHFIHATTNENNYNNPSNNESYTTNSNNNNNNYNHYSPSYNNSNDYEENLTNNNISHHSCKTTDCNNLHTLNLLHTPVQGITISNLRETMVKDAICGMTLLQQCRCRLVKEKATFVQFNYKKPHRDKQLGLLARFTFILLPFHSTCHDHLFTSGLTFTPPHKPSLQKSLLAFNRLVCCLSDLQFADRVVNYCGSILTSLMRDTLGGNSKTSVVMCLAQSSATANHCSLLSSLTEHLSRIRNFPVMNTRIVTDLLSQYRAEALACKVDSQLNAQHCRSPNLNQAPQRAPTLFQQSLLATRPTSPKLQKNCQLCQQQQQQQPQKHQQHCENKQQQPGQEYESKQQKCQQYIAKQQQQQQVQLQCQQLLDQAIKLLSKCLPTVHCCSQHSQYSPQQQHQQQLLLQQNCNKMYQEPPTWKQQQPQSKEEQQKCSKTLPVANEPTQHQCQQIMKEQELQNTIAILQQKLQHYQELNTTSQQQKQQQQRQLIQQHFQKPFDFTDCPSEDPDTVVCGKGLLLSESDKCCILDRLSSLRQENEKLQEEKAQLEREKNAEIRGLLINVHNLKGSLREEDEHLRLERSFVGRLEGSREALSHKLSLLSTNHQRLLDDFKRQVLFLKDCHKDLTCILGGEQGCHLTSGLETSLKQLLHKIDANIERSISRYSETHNTDWQKIDVEGTNQRSSREADLELMLTKCRLEHETQLACLEKELKTDRQEFRRLQMKHAKTVARCIQSERDNQAYQMELNASQNKLKHVIKDFKGRLSSYLTHMGNESKPMLKDLQTSQALREDQLLRAIHFHKDQCVEASVRHEKLLAAYRDLYMQLESTDLLERVDLSLISDYLKGCTFQESKAATKNTAAAATTTTATRNDYLLQKNNLFRQEIEQLHSFINSNLSKLREKADKESRGRQQPSIPPPNSISHKQPPRDTILFPSSFTHSATPNTHPPTPITHPPTPITHSPNSPTQPPTCELPTTSKAPPPDIHTPQNPHHGGWKTKGEVKGMVK